MLFLMWLCYLFISIDFVLLSDKLERNRNKSRLFSRRVVPVRKTLKTALLLVALLSVGLVPVDGARAAETKKTRSVEHKSKVVSATAKKKIVVSAKKRKSQKVVYSRAVDPLSSARDRARQEIGPLAVQSGAALVIDQNGDALYQKNASVVTPIASITKLMTAMVVLDSSPNLQAPIAIT